MKLLSLREIQLKELEILVAFDKFCKENNLRYYLSGGTLLGAIRHKGFIPWDDDIDICMPRPDYKKMIEIFPEKYEEKFLLRCAERNNYEISYARLVDLKTFVDTKRSFGFDNNLWIDIFPVDGVSENINTQKNIFRKGYNYGRILILYYSKFIIAKNPIYTIPKFLLMIFLKMGGTKYFRNQILKMANDYDKSFNVGVLTGRAGIGEVMNKIEFEKTVLVDFEGYKFPTFSCWDSYLKNLYGDYMKLPPEKERESHGTNKTYSIN